jgi:superkiller protein 3
VVQWLPGRAGAWNRLGAALNLAGKLAEAIAAYQQAIALDAKEDVYHYNLGNVYRAQGRYAEAIAAYQQAIALDANDAMIYSSLAAIYRKTGDEEQYQAYVNRARELIADENEYNRACFAAICGAVDEAIALLQAAIAKAPGMRQLAQHDPDFDFIREDARFRALVGSG